MGKLNKEFTNPDSQRISGKPSGKPLKNTNPFIVWLIICSVLVILCGIGLKLLIKNDRFLEYMCTFFPPFFYIGTAVLIAVSFLKRFRVWYYRIIAILLCGYVIIGIATVHNSIKNRIEFEKTFIPKYNLRLLSKVISEYAVDYNGCLPEADRWCDLLMEYDKNLSRGNFKHPLLKSWDCNFAFNKNLGGLRLADIPNDVVLLFEADGDWNLTGTAELLETRRSEHGHINVLFVDQTILDYWFYEDGVRSKDSYTHKPLRWKP